MELELLWAKKPKTLLARPIQFGGVFTELGFSEIIVPALWEQETFTKKIGPEVTRQMWNFKDKGNRDVCLVPEITGILQEQYNKGWKRQFKDPLKIFYVARCYRYEKPQAGRYREFTQIGVEIMSSNPAKYKQEAIDALQTVLSLFDIDYKLVLSVKRGLSYYVEEGFEAVCESLGAQKQLAGGGTYPEGVGWALGLDRLLLAK